MGGITICTTWRRWRELLYRQTTACRILSHSNL